MGSVSSARLAIALAALLLIAGAIKTWWPFVTIERAVITSTPSPGPRVADAIEIPLRPRSRMCVGPLTIDRTTARAAFTVGAPRSGTADLTVVAAGNSYRRAARLDVDLLPAGTPVSARVGSPPRHVTGEVCIRNDGRRPIALFGTSNPEWIGLARTSIDGQEVVNQGMALTLLEERPRSILDRLGTIVRHATDLTGGAVPFVLGWLIVVGFVLITPPAILALYWLVLRDSARE